MTTAVTPRIGRIGIWSMELRFGDSAEPAEAAAELDELGYGALWIPGATGGDLLNDLSHLLAATQHTTIASGILNIWKHQATDVAGWWHELPHNQRARFLLGLGVSHSEAVGAAYAKPLTAMKAYLDRLFDAGVTARAIVLAALGPKMTELARDQTAGAHPYLVTPEHTAIARAALGRGPILAPEQGVVLDANPARARDLARPYVQGYGRLENYANSWRRLGFTDDDIAQTSDRLVDAVFACGDVEVISARLDAHFSAGADHVCLQVVGTAAPGTNDLAALRPVWRRLAEALL
ncbi:TIGR03620 family F420-dependent LLM class oxidoreductase [Sphingomonas sp. SUN039]|uniref:TIGR03620 family F420-dependent LLM class oxidoreductase n=1 Tax=Sphingomonas sp. SUN039 TaxID=2937787 RepID=UPI00216400D1|nr:TIGR03620 family F420-dependent LLM class oxidoreductase [Sphingomonas sp. SUN039]UVO53597.1 TIGR03620 family F420-dependent LLM class oxidoreductase [Sphingomonas sp. SUN039]